MEVLEAAVEAAAEPRGRRARLITSRRRQRRYLAFVLALAGTVGLAVGLTWDHVGGGSNSPAKTAGSLNGKSGAATGLPVQPPANGPGGVGQEPARTGLPAVPAPGGKVRTGTKEQGCFDNIRQYLDAWDKTGVEPDPCFTSQPASDQPQPNDVNRSYNGQRF
jgi:hypothetical protein